MELESFPSPRRVAPDSDLESALEVFFHRPILNSAYNRTDRYWEFDKTIARPIAPSSRVGCFLAPRRPSLRGTSATSTLLSLLTIARELLSPLIAHRVVNHIGDGVSPCIWGIKW